MIVPGTYYNSTKLHSTGILSFRIEDYNHTEWKDGKELLELQLPKILAWLEIKAAKDKHEKEERDKWWEAHREKERIARELEAKKEKDLESFKETLLKATRWHKASNLRNYIDEVERIAKSNAGISEDLDIWLAWARRKADWYDPFTESDDELLNDFDRETLKSKKSY